MIAVDAVTELELAARQLPSVAAVSCREGDDTVRVQVLVTDPSTLPAVRGELEALLSRAPWTGRTVLEVRASGVARRPLALERDVLELPGVRSCHVTRGPRGEIRHVAVVTGPEADLAAVRARLADGLGPDFPSERLQIEASTD